MELEEAQVKMTTSDKLVVSDSDRQLVTYSNMVAVSINAEESFLHFGQRRPDNPAISDGVAKIYLSLPALKRFIIAAAQMVTLIENATGNEIQIDPNSVLVTPEAIQMLQKFAEDHSNDRNTTNID